MSTSLSIGLILAGLFLLLITLRFIRIGRLPLKYSLVWIMIAIVILFCAFLPDWLVQFTQLIGFKTVSNFVIGIMLGSLFLLSMILTMIVSSQKNQIVLLTQEVSLLKSKINEK